MIRHDLENVDESILQQLCNERVQESLTLDFKRSAPGKDDRSKSELLKDVCAFAKCRRDR